MWCFVSLPRVDPTGIGSAWLCAGSILMQFVMRAGGWSSTGTMRGKHSQMSDFAEASLQLHFIKFINHIRYPISVYQIIIFSFATTLTFCQTGHVPMNQHQPNGVFHDFHVFGYTVIRSMLLWTGCRYIICHMAYGIWIYWMQWFSPESPEFAKPMWSRLAAAFSSNS